MFNFLIVMFKSKTTLPSPHKQTKRVAAKFSCNALKMRGVISVTRSDA